jgi:hypothetical protein
MRREMNAFAEKNLRSQDMNCYMYRLLIEYHALTVTDALIAE